MSAVMSRPRKRQKRVVKNQPRINSFMLNRIPTADDCMLTSRQEAKMLSMNAEIESLRQTKEIQEKLCDSLETRYKNDKKYYDDKQEQDLRNIDDELEAEKIELKQVRNSSSAAATSEMFMRIRMQTMRDEAKKMKVIVGDLEKSKNYNSVVIAKQQQKLFRLSVNIKGCQDQITEIEALSQNKKQYDSDKRQLIDNKKSFLTLHKDKALLAYREGGRREELAQAMVAIVTGHKNEMMDVFTTNSIGKYAQVDETLQFEIDVEVACKSLPLGSVLCGDMLSVIARFLDTNSLVMLKVTTSSIYHQLSNSVAYWTVMFRSSMKFIHPHFGIPRKFESLSVTQKRMKIIMQCMQRNQALADVALKGDIESLRGIMERYVNEY
jgi:hypothetical protein